MRSIYSRAISEITGITDPEGLAEIESIMRQDVFHSTLDWQSAELFKEGALEALAVYLARYIGRLAKV
jgi:hypothetical protein